MTGDGASLDGEASEVQAWQKRAEWAMAVMDRTLQGCAQALPLTLPSAQLALGGPDQEPQAFPPNRDVPATPRMKSDTSPSHHLQGPNGQVRRCPTVCS